MYFRTQRDLFPQNEYNPPLGYYDIPKLDHSRKVDFSLKPRTMPKIHIDRSVPGPGAYHTKCQKVEKKRERMRLNARREKIKNDILGGQEEGLASLANVQKRSQHSNFYDVSLSSVKPRVLGALILPEKMSQSQKQDKSKVEDMVIGQQFQEMQDIQEYKQFIKEQVKQQKIVKQQNKLLFEDNLEQMLLRDKMQKSCETPGPGYYNIQKSRKANNSSNYNYSSLPPPPRFKQLSDGPRPAVGQYEHWSAFDYAQSNSPSGVAFKKQLGRKEGRYDDFPGVGDYEVQLRRKQHLMELEYPAVFGSGSKRFKNN